MQYKISCLLLCLFSFSTISAQYTDEINSNRPGFSQGAFSVGKNVLQFESGLGFGNEKHSILGTETGTFAFDYGIRYGLLKEELEISWIGTYQSNSVTTSVGKFKESNFRTNTVGAKYLIYDPYRKRELAGPNLYSWKKNNKFQWEDLIPAVSIYAGANFDFADNPFTPELESSISPKFIISTQNNWVGGWVFVTNIVVDRITTEYPTYGYLLTLTHTVTNWFSVFAENEGFKSDFYSDQLVRGGAAALVNPNFHVDAALVVNFKDTPSVFGARIGVSYRFDMHDEDEFIEDKGKAAREKKRDENGKKAKRKKKKDRKKNKKKNKKLEDGGEEEEIDDGGRI